MTTPYNLRAQVQRGAVAEQQHLADPGASGTVLVPKDLAVVVLESTGARTLEPAADLPLGTSVIVISQADGATVNSIAVDDGEYVKLVVTLNASAAHQWVQESSTAENTPAALEGVYTDALDSATITIDLTETDGAVLALETAEQLIQLSRALAAAGVIDLAIGET